MPVTEKKKQKQKELFKSLGLKPEDFEEKFILSSGRGGQKVNKTSSCVYLKHRPSGIEVKISKDRSRDVNRYLAKEQFLEKYQSKILKIKTTKAKLLAKKKKQKKRRQKKSRKKYEKDQL